MIMAEVTTESFRHKKRKYQTHVEKTIEFNNDGCLLKVKLDDVIAIQKILRLKYNILIEVDTIFQIEHRITFEYNI